jgi:tRNA (mo5U34)-methyltransferase
VIADGVEAIPSFTRPFTPTARLDGLDEPWWWQPNRAGLLRMLRSAGWEIVQATHVYLLPLGPAHPRPPITPAAVRSLLSARGRERLITRLLGVPHVAARVRPLR